MIGTRLVKLTWRETCNLSPKKEPLSTECHATDWFQSVLTGPCPRATPRRLASHMDRTVGAGADDPPRRIRQAVRAKHGKEERNGLTGDESPRRTEKRSGREERGNATTTRHQTRNPRVQQMRRGRMKLRTLGNWTGKCWLWEGVEEEEHSFDA